MAFSAKVSGVRPDLCSCAITSSHLAALPDLACAASSSMWDFIVGDIPRCFSSSNTASASENTEYLYILRRSCSHPMCCIKEKISDAPCGNPARLWDNTTEPLSSTCKMVGEGMSAYWKVINRAEVLFLFSNPNESNYYSYTEYICK
uniref:Uncharacterized protein n=1 Tax=Oryza glumipatula TaxID=40148 RepID=A0A0D9YMW8_9ORYZ